VAGKSIKFRGPHAYGCKERQKADGPARVIDRHVPVQDEFAVQLIAYWDRPLRLTKLKGYMHFRHDEVPKAADPDEITDPTPMYRCEDHWTTGDFAYAPAPEKIEYVRRVRDQKPWPPVKQTEEDFWWECLDTRHLYDGNGTCTRCRKKRHEQFGEAIWECSTVKLSKTEAINNACSSFLNAHPVEVKRALENLERGLCWHTWIAQITVRQVRIALLVLLGAESRTIHLTQRSQRSHHGT
jgi:hypothetical protein